MRDNKTSSNDRGSVLMEAVIVFPLYLFLFGALFSIGEITLGNIQLLSAERLASIWGDRRFGFDDSGKNEKLNNHVKSMFNSTPGSSRRSCQQASRVQPTDRQSRKKVLTTCMAVALMHQEMCMAS